MKSGDRVKIQPETGAVYNRSARWAEFIGSSGIVLRLLEERDGDESVNFYAEVLIDKTMWEPPVLVPLKYLKLLSTGNFAPEPETYVHNPVRPEHYKVGGIEPIEYMRQKMSPEAFRGFCIGNVLKYVGRFEHKNGLEDLKKAKQYLEWGIESYEHSVGGEDQEEKGEEKAGTDGQEGLRAIQDQA
jgi:hypothetical protein